MVGINTSSLTYHIYRMDIEEALETFKELGFRTLEISHSHHLETLKKWSDHFDYLSYHHFTRKRLDREFEDLKEEIKKPLKICRELDVRLLSFHPFFEEDRIKAAVNLKALDEEIEPNLCVENLSPDQNKGLLKTPEDVKSIKKAWDGIGILLDVGHSYKHGNLTEFLKFVDEIREIHLQDVSEEEDKDHLPIGSGDIDFSLLGKIADKPWILDLKHGEEELLEESRIKAGEMKT